MRVFKIEPVGFASNTFAVANGKNQCLLIDCAQPRVLGECVRLGLEPLAVLLTHGHFDHTGGCAALEGHGAKTYCGADEVGFIFSSANLSIFGGVDIPPFSPLPLEEGEHDLFGFDFKVIATPGHTAGGVAYAFGDSLFTGDTLMCGSVGRCDLPTGDRAQLVKSVKLL